MSKTASIERRLDELQRIAYQKKTANLTITRIDGTKIVMGAAEAIDYCKNNRMSVKSVDADVPNYAGLAAALGLCCNPVPDRSIHDFEWQNRFHRPQDRSPQTVAGKPGRWIERGAL